MKTLRVQLASYSKHTHDVHDPYTLIVAWDQGADFKIVNGPYLSVRDSETLVVDGYTHVTLEHREIRTVVRLTKHCSHCAGEYPLSRFGKSKVGLRSWCRHCEKWYRENHRRWGKYENWPIKAKQEWDKLSPMG